jgi:hypothetical protein
MKKLLTLITLLILTISCDRENVQPIEKFGGSRYVIASKHETVQNNYALQLKNKDSIFWVYILEFDGEKIKVGDTIK